MVKSKQGQMNVAALGGIAITIIVAAIILGLGPAIMSSVQDSTDDLSTLANNVTQDIAAANNTFIRLTGVNPPDEIIAGTIRVYNTTTGSAILNSNSTSPYHNWTINYERYALQIDVNAGGMLGGFGYTTGDAWTVQCNASQKSLAYNVTEYGKEGAGELASWIPTICLIIAAAVMVGIVMGSLAGKSQ